MPEPEGPITTVINQLPRALFCLHTQQYGHRFVVMHRKETSGPKLNSGCTWFKPKPKKKKFKTHFNFFLELC